MRRLLLFACALACILCVRPVDAAVINVIAGDHQLNPNTVTAIPIKVFGDARIQGLYLAVQIGDDWGTTGTAPRIADVNVIAAGLLFGGNNNGDNGNGSGAGFGQDAFWESSVTTGTGFASPPVDGSEGILAWVTVDTNNWNIGDKFGLFLLYDEQMVNSAFTSSDLLDQVFVNGSIEIVPEPSSFLLMFAGVAGLGLVTLVRRKRNG